MALEVIDFDNAVGPLTGLYREKNDQRPAVLPSKGWKGKYKPSPGDMRATGTIYLNVPIVQAQLQVTTNGKGLLGRIKQLLGGTTAASPLGKLDQWSINPVYEVATAPYEEQLDVLEQALSDLLLLVKARFVKYPPEKGKRGFANLPPYLDEVDAV